MSEVGLEKTALDTPVLWVDLDLLESNITRLAAHFKAAGVGWRPHTKGMKVPAIAHKAIAAGAIGVTCAKLGEAEVMAAAGIRDILIANQIVGAKKIERLVNLQRHAEVKVAVDCEANILEIGQAAVAKGVEVGLLVDVNNGMNRTGVAPGQPALELSRLAHATAGVRYLGLMAYEGHAIEIDDSGLKRQKIEEAVGLLAMSAELCREAGLPVQILSGGGSGTYKVTPFLPGITEIQAGGAIFSDIAYQAWEVETTPCLFVRATVTSRAVPNRLVFDAGWKALPAWFAYKPKAIGLAGVASMAMSAEHGVVTLEAPNDAVHVGDAFDFIVGYGDMTVFLHDQLYGVRAGIVEVVWDIQGRGKLR
jgi:D-serine deaminase-like pyridoxal phosphate-dependent protein